MDQEKKERFTIQDPRSKWLNRVLGMISIYPPNAKFATQNKNEEIVIILRRHFITNFSWIILTIFLVFLPFILLSLFRIYDHNLNGDALMNSDLVRNIDSGYIIALFLFYLSFIISYGYFNYIHWYFDLFIFTNERYISIDFSILKGRMITDIPLTDIIDISEKVYGFFPTIMGYGSIEFKTTSEKLSIMPNVPQTVWIRDSLSDLIRFIRRIKVVKSKETVSKNVIVKNDIDKEKTQENLGEENLQEGDNEDEAQIDQASDENVSDDNATDGSASVGNVSSDNAPKDEVAKKNKQMNSNIFTEIAGNVLTEQEENKNDNKNKVISSLEP